MLKENDYIYLHKFGSDKWMKELQQGKMSLSALGSWIEQAMKTGNIDQGDIHEGVFARLPLGDPRIQEAADYLGEDLEQIQNGNFVLLRRKSSYFIPTFCIFGITVGDLLTDSTITAPGWQKLRINYDERLYKGFTKSSEEDNDVSFDENPSQFIVEAGEFESVVLKALRDTQELFLIRKVDYSLFADDIFYLDPVGDRREELFHKMPYYKYQKELRICIPLVQLPTIYDRYPLTMSPFDPQKSSVVPNATLYGELNVNIAEWEEEEKQ